MKNIEPQPQVRKVFNDAFAVMKNPNPDGAAMGDLIIHENAIIAIIKRTVSGLKGFSRFSGSSLIDNIAEIVRSKKIQDRSITVSFQEDSIVVELSLFAYFGTNLPELASSIQQMVTEEIRKQTGLRVECVNVNFRGLDEESAESEE